LFIMPQILFSQTQSDELRNNAKEIRMQERIGTPAYMSFNADYSLTHEQAIEYSKGFCTNSSFTLKNQQTGKNGKTLYRYTQTIAGYPVEFSAWHIHEKNGKVTAVNGDIVGNQDFNVVFSISEEAALQMALNHIGAEVYMWAEEGEERHLKFVLNDNAATYYPTGVKIITPIQPDIRNNELRTAYKFDIYSKQPHDRKMVYVDAQTGEILFDLPLIHFHDKLATAHTAYSEVQEIGTFFDETQGSQYIMHDRTRGNGVRTFNLHHGTDFNAATDFFNPDTIWIYEPGNLNQYATDAHFATTATYDYLLDIHGRNSIDDKGFNLLSFVHYSVNYVNAFWNGWWMTYGDGNINQGVKPFTTVDICGHEVTHGLTEKTAGLVYAYEPGALNEAFSDIFGTAIEFFAVPEYANWTMGEKSGMIIRSLSNPKKYLCPDTYKGQFWVGGNQDYGGVHTNSGVLNYWFYLLCEGGSGTNDNGHYYEVEAIGMEKAEQIAFSLLVEYLTPTSQYSDAFYYALIAAYELFPETVQSVGDAFYAVGVITEPFNSAVNFKASETLIKEEKTVQFSDMSLSEPTAWQWYFEGGDPETSTDQNPSVLYKEPGRFDVKLVVEHPGGIDSLHRVNYIRVIPYPPTADFYAETTEIVAGESVLFINLSEHYPDTYQWFFDGGTPMETGDKDPVVQFREAGTFSVRLKTINAGGFDIELKAKYIHVAPKTAIAEQDIASQITIYPNPTSGEIQVTSYELQVTSVEIYDVMGRKQEIIFNFQLSTFNLTNLPNGIYFLQITTDKGIITKKIVKE
ncbi:MAG: M4 family metallopeptidase, partial [Bacteroidales bacterium]|nr:M4 family metallopeptidase [Bacteroidales bacterium]